MIISIITMYVQIEKQKEVMQTLLSIIDQTSTEKGCLSYNVLRDIENQNAFILLGECNTHDNLDLHIESDSFSVLLGTRSLLCEPMSIQIHTVSKTEGIELINYLRGKVV